MDWNTRFEVTPIGAYVNRLHAIDQRLAALEHPGIYAQDPRVSRLARAALSAVDTLRGALHDELAQFGGLPLGPDPEEETEARIDAIVDMIDPAGVLHETPAPKPVRRFKPNTDAVLSVKPEIADGPGYCVVFEMPSGEMWSAGYTLEGELWFTLWNTNPGAAYRKVDPALLAAFCAGQ